MATIERRVDALEAVAAESRISEPRGTLTDYERSFRLEKLVAAGVIYQDAGAWQSDGSPTGDGLARILNTARVVNRIAEIRGAT